MPGWCPPTPVIVNTMMAGPLPTTPSSPYDTEDVARYDGTIRCMGPVEQKVRACKNVRDAILVLARAVDEQNQGVNLGWEAPLWEDRAEQALHDESLEAGLEDLDPAQRAEALAARRRLAEDSGTTAESVEDSVVRHKVSSDGIEAEFPIGTPEQEEIRKRVLPQLDFSDLEGIDPEDATSAFIAAGPLWLHAFDRAYVMSLPEETRRVFVMDVEHQSTRDAQELGRDILKSMDPGGLPEGAWGG